MMKIPRNITLDGREIISIKLHTGDAYTVGVGFVTGIEAYYDPCASGVWYAVSRKYNELKVPQIEFRVNGDYVVAVQFLFTEEVAQ